MRLVTLTVITSSLCFSLFAQLAPAQKVRPGNQEPTEPGELEDLVTASIQTGRDTDGRFVLRGRHSRQQLYVSGQSSSGQITDLTRQVSYEMDPPNVVTVSPTGLVTPLANGTAKIEATHTAGVTAAASVTVESWGEDLPVNFPNQIVPIFTKLTCNAGGCHGKSGGQNGFRLSLLGFEPLEDYEYLLKEARGRRLSIASPERSLVLLKPTGTVPHGGGQRFEVGDDVYRLMHRWISQGAPLGDPDAAQVASIAVFPQARMMSPGSQQQLVVVARYTDGTTEDVTAMAQYEPNIADMAEVSDTGVVNILEQTGDVAVMARYQSQVTVFRATVPLGAPVDELPPMRNFIDKLVFDRLKLLGMPPSRVCDDTTFIRRITIDATGRLPTSEQVESFLASTAPDKRDQTIDSLLASHEYADCFANKWSAILRNKRAGPDSRRGNYAFHAWLRDALHHNLPYNQFVRAIVAASGEAGGNPPVVWYRQVNELTEQAEDTAQLFLGLRIQCARCHHHPFEQWSREDYYRFSAFFSRVGRKAGMLPGEERIFHRRGMATAVNPKNGQTVTPAGLGGQPLELSPESDPRQALVDWMSGSENPFFAPMLVNRYWKHFFGRGLVDPEDDLRATNPATNPELFDALANHFENTGFDLKDLVRTICQSSTYQLSSQPNQYNAADKQTFSRYYPRRLTAEVLLDAVDQVAGTFTQFDGMPTTTRAVQLPDSGFNVEFLKAFGRPEAASACECERVSDADLIQSLHLINSADIHRKLSSETGRATRLAADQERDHPEKIRELYLSALSRLPTADETTSLLQYLKERTTEKDGNLRAAYEDIVWTLINTKEFLFNH